jgi:hypothetical protein
MDLARYIKSDSMDSIESSGDGARADTDHRKALRKARDFLTKEANERLSISVT